jgi:hypothetical protein
MTHDDAELEQRAGELFPGDEYLQQQWLRGVRLVRTTARGWCLDPLPLQQGPRDVHERPSHVG